MCDHIDSNTYRQSREEIFDYCLQSINLKENIKAVYIIDEWEINNN